LAQLQPALAERSQPRLQQFAQMAQNILILLRQELFASQEGRAGLAAALRQSHASRSEQLRLSSRYLWQLQELAAGLRNLANELEKAVRPGS
jgi:hypothetical protein